MSTAAAMTETTGAVRSGSRRGYTTAWWGMVTLITTEAMVFAVLLSAYFFLRASAKEWPIGGLEPPELTWSVPFSFVLWGSSVPLVWAEAGIRHGNLRRLRIGLAVSFVMACAFLAWTVKDFADLHFGWRDNAYGSIFYTVVGLHTLHVVVGALMNVVVQVKAWQGKLSAGRHRTVEVFALYWHFVDGVWLFVFPALFLSAHVR